MKRPTIILGLALFALLIVAQARDTAPPTHASIGRGVGVHVAGGDRDCWDGVEHYANHDGSFEDGYAWQYGGVVPPCYGAFAEGFSLGVCTVPCVRLRLTTLSGYFADQPLDVYVWRSDGTNPSTVVGMTAGVHLEDPVGLWPNVTTHDIDINNVAVPGDFFVGFWGDWPGESPGWFIAADLDGPGGMPRTNIAPGIGYPTGWQDPSIVWGPVQSLGIETWIGYGGAGACCHPDGTCEEIQYHIPCGGVFLGIGTTCDECAPPATGACCDSDGSCAITTRFECESGDWRIDAPCEPNPCPALPLGACCVEGICTLTAEADCPAGSWLGPNTHCEPIPCPEPPTATADCADYESYAHRVGGAATYGQAADVAVANGYACVAGYWSGLQVVDVRDLRDPRTVAWLPLPHATDAVAASGTHAYAGAGDELIVVDIANPETPFVAGSLDIGDVRGIAVKGDFAYVVDAYNLVIVNVAVPQSPWRVGSVPVENALGVVAAEEYAYVACHTAGLTVIDITNAQAPRIVGTADTPGEAWKVAVAEGRACIADGSAGLAIVDVADPAHPELLGSADTPADARGVDVSGACACVADSDGGLLTVDISDPRHPEVVGQVRMPGGEIAGSVDLTGTFACVAGYLAGLQVIDVANPRTATILGRVEVPGAYEGVAVAGSYAYVNGGPGLQVIDVSDPADMEVVGSASLPEYDDDVDVCGSHAYVAGWYGSPREDGYLQAVDVADPTHPRPMGIVDLPHAAERLTVSGTRAFVVGGVWDSGWSLCEVDVADPQDLRVVADLALPALPCDIAVSGDYAFVADGRAGLLAIDVSVPSNPRIVGSVAPVQGFSALAVGVSGGIACVALDGGIQVVDIAQPSNLRNLGFSYVYWTPYAVSLHGTHAAIGEGSGVVIADLADPWNPRIVGAVAHPRWGARDVVAASGYLYSICGTDGLRVFRQPCEAEADDGENASADDLASDVPGVRALPNPALRRATIRLELVAGGFVHATIHDLTGRRIRDLFSAPLPAAAHELSWDGRDDSGRDAAAGVYLARISTAAGKTTRRLVLLR